MIEKALNIGHQETSSAACTHHLHLWPTQLTWNVPSCCAFQWSQPTRVTACVNFFSTSEADRSTASWGPIYEGSLPEKEVEDVQKDLHGTCAFREHFCCCEFVASAEHQALPPWESPEEKPATVRTHKSGICIRSFLVMGS